VIDNGRRYVECPCLTIGRLALLLPIDELYSKNEFTNSFSEPGCHFAKGVTRGLHISFVVGMWLIYQ